MSDWLVWFIGLSLSAWIWWWVFYRRAQVQRRVEKLQHVADNGYWVRLPEKDEYEFNLPSGENPAAGWPYRAYYSFRAFLARLYLNRDTDD